MRMAEKLPQDQLDAMKIRERITALIESKAGSLLSVTVKEQVSILSQSSVAS